MLREGLSNHQQPPSFFLCRRRAIVSYLISDVVMVVGTSLTGTNTVATRYYRKRRCYCTPGVIVPPAQITDICFFDALALHITFISGGCILLYKTNTPICFVCAESVYRTRCDLSLLRSSHNTHNHINSHTTPHKFVETPAAYHTKVSRGQIP